MERVVKAAAPGAFLVEIMPWMLHLPDSIAKWKREGKQRFKEDSEMFKSFLGDVRKQVVRWLSFAIFVPGGDLQFFFNVFN